MILNEQEEQEGQHEEEKRQKLKAAFDKCGAQEPCETISEAS